MVEEVWRPHRVRCSFEFETFFRRIRFARTLQAVRVRGLDDPSLLLALLPLASIIITVTAAQMNTRSCSKPLFGFPDVHPICFFRARRSCGSSITTSTDAAVPARRGRAPCSSMELSPSRQRTGKRSGASLHPAADALTWCTHADSVLASCLNYCSSLLSQE